MQVPRRRRPSRLVVAALSALLRGPHLRHAGVHLKEAVIAPGHAGTAADAHPGVPGEAGKGQGAEKRVGARVYAECPLNDYVTSVELSD